MGKQDETVSEEEHRVYSPAGEGDSLFPSEGFPAGPSEKGDRKSQKPGEGKTFFSHQMFPSGDRLHIE